MISGLLLNIGTIIGFWGVIWYMWDHRATAPGWLLGAGLICLLAGEVMA